ncbi:MAG: translation initiation factor IF-2 [Bacteroidota bacterium]
MTKRLVKIAKELNVGTTTIVEYLNKNGYDIENKPTAKVTDAMYDALIKEFQKSIAIKKKAKNLVIGNRSSKDEGSVDVTVAEPPQQEIINTEVESTDNGNGAENNPVTEVAVKEEVTEEKHKIQSKIKVVGKIDLGSRLQRKAEKKQQSKRKKAAPAPTPTPEVQEAKTTEKENSNQPQDTPTTETEEKQVNVEAKNTPSTQAEETVSPTKNPEDTAQKDQPDSKEEGKVESTEEQDPSTEKKGVVRVEAPELRGLKILGKIDTDKFKRPSKKKKETKKEGEKEGSNSRDDRRREGDKDRNRTDRPRREGDRDRNRTDRPRREGDRDRNRDERPRREGDRDRNRDDRPRREGDRDRNRDDRPRREGDRDRNRTERPRREGDRDRNRTERPRREGDRDRNRTERPKREGDKDRNRESGSGSSGFELKPQTSGEGSGTKSGSGTSEEPKRRRRRKRVQVENKTQNNDQGRRGNSRSRRSDNKNDEVKEVSQKEIDEKIKATMARLSGGGKKKRQRLQRDKRERKREKEEQRLQEAETGKLQLTEFVSVQELANLMDVPVTDVIMTCMNLGVIVSINQRLDAEIIELVAEEFGHEIEFISAEEEVEEEEEIVDDPEDLEPRAPIVTVMGHVDHGKTSLLDYIREANVASGEAGGITQHIGAYEVVVGEEKKRITFLDTPGHEAFTAMRARGAKVTDIAIIIIAADDSIMPQTKEAISHAQAAGVPIIFAINKIDKMDAQPDRIKQELSGMNFLVEEWGGQYQSQDISAKTGLNIDLLLEKVLLEAEMLELKANPDRNALGTVIEASLEKGRGYVTKILVQNGTMKIGDPIVAGEHSGKVRAMLNERGKRVKTAGPSKPVLVLGLDGAPQAGERVKMIESEQEARQMASRRAQISREQANRATKRISLDEIGRRLALGNFKELNLIVKGDVDGSVEALSDSLIKLSIESVQVNVIHKAVGQIIESDVLLATASDAIIIGFQVRPSLNARKLAEREGVEIKMYSIIYEAIEQIKLAIEGMLEPDKEERIMGQVEVREVYKISKVGTVAGCYVQEGKISRNSHIRLIRNGIVTYPTKEGVHGELASLKRFKDDIKEVKAGFECGMTIKNYNDIKVGDTIEAYEIVEVKRKLK